MTPDQFKQSIDAWRAVLEPARLLVLEVLGTKTKDAWDARETLKAHFNKNLSQVGAIFFIAIAAMGLGFIVMMWGVFLAITNPDSIKTSSLVAFSGIITELIGATFMLIYRYTMAQANQYVEVLERLNTAGRAEQILDAIPEAESELKNKTRAEIARLLLVTTGSSARYPTGPPPAYPRTGYLP